jgi:hypothetical protein
VLKENSIILKPENFNLPKSALGIEAASPELEKQGFLAVVFVNWEYSG